VNRCTVSVPRLRPALSLVPWLGLLCLFGLVLWRPGALATAGLFQSDLPTPTESATSTSVVETPVSPPISPTLTLTSPLTGTLPTSTWTAQPEPSPGPSATATWSPTALPEPTPGAEVTPSEGAEPRYPVGQADLKFRWRTLIDSIALGVSYLWLVCGIALFVLLGVAFAWAWLRGRRRPAD